MSDQYGFQARRAQGGVNPLGGLAQIIQNFLGGRPQPPEEPRDPNKPTVPLSGDNINAQQPAQELLADGPNQAVPQDQPPEVPQDQPPEQGASTKQAPEVEREPDTAQPDPTTQPIIDPDLSGAQQVDEAGFPPGTPPDATTGARTPVDPNAIHPPARDPSLASPVSPGSMREQGLGRWPQQVRPGARFQAFVPSGIVGFKDWGKETWQNTVVDENIERTNLRPSKREAYGVYANAGSQLGQWASPAVSAPAMAAGAIAKMLGPFIDLLSGGGRHPFTQAFSAAETQSLAKQKFLWQQQKDYMEMQRDHMMDLGDQAVRTQRAEIEEARDAVAEYDAGIINEEQLGQRIRDWGNRTGHQKAAQAYESGGLKAFEYFLGRETAKINDLAGAGKTLREGDRKRQAAAGTPEGGLDEAWLKGDDSRRGDRPPMFGDRSRGTKEAAQESKATSPEEHDSEIADHNQLNEDGMAAARQLAETGLVNGKTPNQVAQQAKKGGQQALVRYDNAANELKQRIDNAVRGEGSEAEKLAKLEQISPYAAGTVRGLANYEKDLNKMPSAVRERYYNWTKAISGQYNPGLFNQAQDFHNPAKPSMKIMTKADALANNAAQIWAGTYNRDEDTNIPKETIKMWLAGNWKGDPEYAVIGEALQNFQINANSIQSQRGSPYVTLVQMMVDRAGPNVSPRTIRAVVQTVMSDVFSHVNAGQNNWETYNKQTIIPGMTPSAWKIFSDISRANPYNGAVASDSHIALLGANKDPSKAAKSVRGNDEQNYVPLTAQQARSVRDKIKELEADQSPRARAQAQVLRRMITGTGVPLDPPWLKEYLGLPGRETPIRENAQ